MNEQSSKREEKHCLQLQVTVWLPTRSKTQAFCIKNYEMSRNKKEQRQSPDQILTAFIQLNLNSFIVPKFYDSLTLSKNTKSTNTKRPFFLDSVDSLCKVYDQILAQSGLRNLDHLFHYQMRHIQSKNYYTSQKCCYGMDPLT